MSSPEKRKRCDPGCECGRHRRKVAQAPEVAIQDRVNQLIDDLAAVKLGAGPTAVVPTEEFAAEMVAVPIPVTLKSPPEVEVSVLVPARLDRDRRDLWEFLRPRWEAFGYEIVEGTCVGPWCKASAVADALSRASGRILVITDADVWSDGIPAAVARVKAGAAWAIPHYLVRRLTLPATLTVLETGAWPVRRTTTTYAQPPYPGRPGGGVVVLTREAYAKVPMDPRFTGWGQEDESWALALGTMLGRSWRGLADLWHLWHDPAPRQSRTFGSQKSMALHRRYTTAHRQPTRMSALLAEMPR